MIPGTKLNAVKYALKEAFGTDEFSGIKQVTIGLSSALIFRITVKERPYLLRVIMRDDAMADPSHYFDNMKLAANAGIAPRILYLSTADRISITDFINAAPFPLGRAKTMLPALLKRLHSLPRFPFRLNYIDTMDVYAQKIRAEKILPRAISDELFDVYSRAKNAYPISSEDMVSCHNDLKPENIIFDGERPWLVDWEAAFLNDRYLDLAVVANFVIRKGEDEADFLKNYFGSEAGGYHCARLFLMRQLLHMAYVSMFISITHKPGAPFEWNENQPGFREFHDQMWNGAINLAEREAKMQYALVHIRQLLDNAGSSRVDDAVKVVSAYNRK
ncbi:MAG: phosphotransferase [Bacteroidetes bacterium]|nr:phosphotransferase [Bacteroidota bacterium]MBS1975115.1 phosphotransferase [Bacteroidota bacterium]